MRLKGNRKSIFTKRLMNSLISRRVKTTKYGFLPSTSSISSSVSLMKRRRGRSLADVSYLRCLRFCCWNSTPKEMLSSVINNVKSDSWDSLPRSILSPLGPVPDIDIPSMMTSRRCYRISPFTCLKYCFSRVSKSINIWVIRSRLRFFNVFATGG